MPAPAARDAGTTHGPCERCAHVREGRSLAHAAYPLLLRTIQPSVNSAQMRAADDERYALRDLQQENAEFRKTGTGEWRRPPTDRSFSYCGLDEFQQRFYACEVKNTKDRPCDDFLADGSRRRACKSCAYNRQPSDRIYQTMMQILSERPMQGTKVRSDVDMTLQSQATSEYRQCLETAGFLDVRPGLLPFCEKYSTSDGEAGARYVVGPIVNAGNSCPHWSEGANAAARDWLATLDALLDRARRAAAAPPPAAPPNGLRFAGTTYSQTIQRHHDMQSNAKGDVVEFCLLTLGMDAAYAASEAAMFVADSWQGQRPADSLKDALAELAHGGARPAPAAAAPAGASDEALRAEMPRQQAGFVAGAVPHEAAGAPAAPAGFPPPAFQLQQNFAYPHPANPGIRLVLTGGVASVVLPDGMPIQFDLATFQPGVWMQLLSPFGPLPVSLNVQWPNAVFAMWG